jgi:hypothetical protein
MQLLTVSDDAAVPAGMFLKPPVWTPICNGVHVHRQAFVNHQLRAEADSEVTYVLARGAQLPGGVTLTQKRVLTGCVTETEAGTSSVDVRVLVGGAGAYASATQTIKISVC